MQFRAKLLLSACVESSDSGPIQQIFPIFPDDDIERKDDDVVKVSEHKKELIGNL